MKKTRVALRGSSWCTPSERAYIIPAHIGIFKDCKSIDSTFRIKRIKSN